MQRDGFFIPARGATRPACRRVRMTNENNSFNFLQITRKLAKIIPHPNARRRLCPARRAAQPPVWLLARSGPHLK